MSFRKVELTAVVCDGCDAQCAIDKVPEYAEAEARDRGLVIRMKTAGKHICLKCMAEIAKGEAKR